MIYNIEYKTIDWKEKIISMKKIIILFIILFLGISPFSGCIEKGDGTLLLMITDKPPEINISKALVTISSVSVHRVNIRNDNKENNTGWYTINNKSQTFDLIKLRNISDILGEIVINVGVYNQIRLHLEKSIVTIDGIEYDLKIPSKIIKINTNFLIFEDMTTTLILDFDIQKSVHRADNDEYILKPVIKLI